MIKILGFYLMVTNYQGGPIVSVRDGSFNARFDTMEQCDAARKIMSDNTIGYGVAYICMPKIEVE